MALKNEQEDFWENKYAKEYIKKNDLHDNSLGVQGWAQMLHKVKDEIKTYLECGCNIGRNIEQLKILMSDVKPSVIEISKPAFDIVTSKHDFDNKFNGTILDSNFELNSFDLVFTMGVLIHIHPDNLLAHMRKIYNYSSKYILFGEYFNRTPVMLEYQGEKQKLFKSDFGKTFIDNFDVKLVDYGFLWGHIYDSAGFDDITWWLFKKN